MISKQELNPHNYPLDAEQEHNQLALLTAINIIRAAWSKPMLVTSGVRSAADQARINPSAPKSKHLIGAAVDISDPKKELQKWCKNNIALLETAGLWMEDFTHTPNWCHFQILPYGSWVKGKSRWFIP